MSPAPRSFGTTWWGRAWLDTLENSGTEFADRLPAGRSTARRGQVHDIEVHPGHVAARVVDNTGELLPVDLAVRVLAPAEQEQVIDAIASRAAHLAALLDGEMHPGIVQDAREVDVELLPRPRDLRPDCPCPDIAEPCRHAAAVCYVIADQLDADPFLLFLLRGVPRDELLAAVRSRRAAESPVAADSQPPGEAQPTVPPGQVDAADAWSGHGTDDELGALSDWARSHVSSRQGPPLAVSAWGPELPPRSGVDTEAIDSLALDAARRAWAMLVDGAPSYLSLGANADIARRAADDPARLLELAATISETPATLRVLAEAWRLGGEHAVTVVSDQSSWSTDQEQLASGREQLVDAGHPRRSIALSFDSLGMANGVWFVLGPDQRWWALTGAERHGQLRLAGPPAEDIGELLSLL